MRYLLWGTITVGIAEGGHAGIPFPSQIPSRASAAVWMAVEVSQSAGIPVDHSHHVPLAASSHPGEVPPRAGDGSALKRSDDETVEMSNIFP